MIKAVIFDWGGVLIHDPSIELMDYCAKKLGISVDILKIEYQVYEKDFQKGKTKESEVWHKICKKLAITMPQSGSIWKEGVEYSFKNNEQVIDIARELKKKGFKLGFLSNTEIPAFNFFKKQNYDFLDVSVFSCLEGYVKPEKEIYEIILNRLGVQPEEAIFIDDRAMHIEGAKKLGINTILFTNAENLTKKLQNYGVNTGGDGGS